MNGQAGQILQLFLRGQILQPCERSVSTRQMNGKCMTLLLVLSGHARARDETVVSASRVYFLPSPPRYAEPGQPSSLSLRHIVDMVGNCINKHLNVFIVSLYITVKPNGFFCEKSG